MRGHVLEWSRDEGYSETSIAACIFPCHAFLAVGLCASRVCGQAGSLGQIIKVAEVSRSLVDDLTREDADGPAPLFGA